MDRRRARRRPALPTALLPLLAVLGCGTEPEPDPVPTSIDVTGPTQRLGIGATAKLTAAVQAGPTPVPGAAVVWSSLDTTTVAVDATGTVRAVRTGETWVTGAAGTVRDSVLVEVAHTLSPREGRVRVRSQGIETALVFAGATEPIVLQFDYLGRNDEEWVVGAFTAAGDTVLFILLPQMPDGTRQPLLDFTAATLGTLEDDDITKPLAFLEIYNPTEKIVPLSGFIEMSVEQAVPAGRRLGLTRVRLVGTGNVWRTTSTGGWIVSAETAAVVADLRPAYQHDALGTSAGQITGVPPQTVTWTLRQARWSATTENGRTGLLEILGTPRISTYLPGTVGVELGTAAQTTRGLLGVRDSVRNYTGTATAGQVQISSYTPATADVYGEIHGTVTGVTGTGATGAGAAAPFSAGFDFHAPVLLPTSAAPPLAPGRDAAHRSASPRVRAWMERFRRR